MSACRKCNGLGVLPPVDDICGACRGIGDVDEATAFALALDRVRASLDQYATTRSVKALLVLEAELAELRRAHEPVAERSAERWRRTRGVT